MATETSTATFGSQHDHEVPMIILDPTSRPLSEGHAEPQEPARSTPAQDWKLLVKLISCGVSFFVAGVNDGSIGTLLPYVIRTHGLTTAIVSSVYACNFFGWLFAAVTNSFLIEYLDLGAMIALGAVLQIVAQALRVWKTPFPLFAVTFWITSIGQGYQDTHGNSFVASSAKNAHRWLGFIHAMYMAGCLVAPFAASPIASMREPSVWYLFYSIPAGLGVFNLALCLVAFRETVRLRPKGVQQSSSGSAPTSDQSVPESRPKAAVELVKRTVKQKSLWYISVFFFFYLGMVLTASGWVVEYLVDVRNGELSQVAFIPAGVNGGALLGRILLPEPTHRYGERLMGTSYLVICLAMQLVFWRVPNIVAASVAISIFGFFSGPLFAAAMSVGSRLFTAETRSTALALVFVAAQTGGSIFPIATGLLATAYGAEILQPILVTLIAISAVCWMAIPRPKQSQNDELHRE